MFLRVRVVGGARVSGPPPLPQEYLCNWLDWSCACIHAGNFKHICINTHTSFRPSTVAPSREWSALCIKYIWTQWGRRRCLSLLIHYFYFYSFCKSLFFFNKKNKKGRKVRAGPVSSQSCVLFLLSSLFFFHPPIPTPHLRELRFRCTQVDHMFARSARVAGWEPAHWGPGPGQGRVWFDKQWDPECGQTEMEVGVGPKGLYPAD